jgi:hypothetical protein
MTHPVSAPAPAPTPTTIGTDTIVVQPMFRHSLHATMPKTAPPMRAPISGRLGPFEAGLGKGHRIDSCRANRSKWFSMCVAVDDTLSPAWTENDTGLARWADAGSVSRVTPQRTIGTTDLRGMVGMIKELGHPSGATVNPIYFDPGALTRKLVWLRRVFVRQRAWPTTRLPARTLREQTA